MPTIQDVIEKAKMYVNRGVSQEEAIRRAISASTPGGMPQKVKNRGFILQ